jgi:ABC-type Fe3+/spermidine/putrescine transport system ATPase subunit
MTHPTLSGMRSRPPQGGDPRAFGQAGSAASAWKRDRWLALSLRKGIEKTYPNGFKAVHGVDLEVRDGEFMVFVGPSGCAKSTLLRMIAGLESISAGELRIGDRVVNALPPKQRGIAMVFQNYALYPHMTVYDNLGLRPQAGGQDPEGGARPARAPGRQAAGDGASAGALPQAAQRRPGAARGGGPRHRQEARGLPVRRAAVQPGRQAARQHARAPDRAAPHAARTPASPPPPSTSRTTRSRP